MGGREEEMSEVDVIYSLFSCTRRLYKWYRHLFGVVGCTGHRYSSVCRPEDTYITCRYLHISTHFSTHQSTNPHPPSSSNANPLHLHTPLYAQPISHLYSTTKSFFPHGPPRHPHPKPTTSAPSPKITQNTPNRTAHQPLSRNPQP